MMSRAMDLQHENPPRNKGGYKAKQLVNERAMQSEGNVGAAWNVQLRQ